MAARSQPLAFKDWQSKPGDLHLETFKEKGRGSYGVVRVGEWQERSVAVKTLHDILLEADGRQKEELVKSFKEECLKLRRLDDHRRVVKLIATFRDERGRPLLVMEALEESLEDYLLRNVGKLSVLRQISIVSELADGLAYLHENNIVHRDLKPANVLMGKDGHIRIADLGQAKLLANIEQLMTTLQPGTILFLPPETLQDGGSPYTFSIDCFSLGVVALCVATQSLPTCGFAQIGTVEEAVRRKKDLVKLPKGHPLKAIILGCLQNTPSLRPRSFFIKEHTQALMEIEGCRSRLEERDKTVIQLREELQTLQKRMEYLRKEKEMEIEGYKSRLQEQDKTVIQQEQKLQTQKEQIEYLQKERAAVPFGRPEVADFCNVQVLGPETHKIVAFGFTAHGKSSFLNFLLKAKEDIFSTWSSTKKNQTCSAMIGGEQWILIDTPGIFDTDQLQEGIEENIEAQIEQQKQEFCRNMRRAYLEAGKEVSAFQLVYDCSTRWSLEMTLQINFLNSIQFPWSHSILVITHADAAFKKVEEEQRYDEFLKKVKDPKSKLPSQLKKLVQSMSYRVILVESGLQKKDDGYHESVVTRMKDYIAEIAGKHGKYRNELFDSIGKK